LECSQLDLTRKRYLMRSLNKTYWDHISCYEVLEYFPHPEHNDKTILTQKAEIDMYVSDYNFSIRWAVNKGEGLFANEYIANSKKGRIGLESVIVKLQKEWAELESLAKTTSTEVEELTKQCIKEGTKVTKQVITDGTQVAVKCINDGGEVAKKAIDETTEVAKVFVEACAEATLSGIDERARR